MDRWEKNGTKIVAALEPFASVVGIHMAWVWLETVCIYRQWGSEGSLDCHVQQSCIAQYNVEVAELVFTTEKFVFCKSTIRKQHCRWPVKTYIWPFRVYWFHWYRCPLPFGEWDGVIMWPLHFICLLFEKGLPCKLGVFYCAGVVRSLHDLCWCLDLKEFNSGMPPSAKKDRLLEVLSCKHWTWVNVIDSPSYCRRAWPTTTTLI